MSVVHYICSMQDNRISNGKRKIELQIVLWPKTKIHCEFVFAGWECINWKWKDRHACEIDDDTEETAGIAVKVDWERL